MLMNPKELMVGYDKEVDVLHISSGKSQKRMQYIELNSNLILRVEPKYKEIVGITITDFSKQSSGERYFSKVPVMASFLPDEEISSLLETVVEDVKN